MPLYMLGYTKHDNFNGTVGVTDTNTGGGEELPSSVTTIDDFEAFLRQDRPYHDQVVKVDTDKPSVYDRGSRHACLAIFQVSNSPVVGVDTCGGNVDAAVDLMFSSSEATQGVVFQVQNTKILRKALVKEGLERYSRDRLIILRGAWLVRRLAGYHNAYTIEYNPKKASLILKKRTAAATRKQLGIRPVRKTEKEFTVKAAAAILRDLAWCLFNKELSVVTSVLTVRSPAYLCDDRTKVLNRLIKVEKAIIAVHGKLIVTPRVKKAAIAVMEDTYRFRKKGDPETATARGYRLVIQRLAKAEVFK